MVEASETKPKDEQTDSIEEEKKSAPAIKTQAWTALYKQRAAYQSEQRSGSGRNNSQEAVGTTVGTKSEQWQEVWVSMGSDFFFFSAWQRYVYS